MENVVAALGLWAFVWGLMWFLKRDELRAYFRDDESQPPMEF